MTNKIKICPFKDEADRIRREEVNAKDALKNDLSEDFFPWCYNKIDSGELLDILCIGDVTTGKSTAALQIRHKINRYLEATKKHDGPIDDYGGIASDRIEANRLLCDPNRNNEMLQVDEISEMEEIGTNSTAEQKITSYAHTSMAQIYCHRITCTPNVPPTGTFHGFLVLEVIGKNTKQKITHCKVIYTYPGSATEQGWTCIGRIDLEVTEILGQPYYLQYRDKKFARLDLVRKHGLQDIRPLEAAELTLMLYEQTRGLAKLGASDIAKGILKTILKRVLQEKRMIYTLLAENAAVEGVMGLMGFDNALRNLEEKHVKAQIALEKGGTPAQRELHQRNIKNIEDTIIKLKQELADALAVYEGRIQIFEEYKRIGTEVHHAAETSQAQGERA